ncbi:RNA-binding protein [Candidatus Woesebacteria bacterium RIFCSPHIGHO2_01_FULL_44_21]|uniref:RNA-binding protein n=1 Tax=Candidatus Woesebacteria bacterium RIFCSPHIGHO2_01_FULL_44_21 TaxID=1802503 RepID=A0A1F7Z1B3_9BACT|nr:MAG: RNA-binding protein [Candidatus Woesebacteria bacterium RIFCSPHIGHO2_01_FULL_44_21]OGM69115.1 MAG: RNA-binding protein [Candidatus Woesebacteria bacterium RIFCSPLOWO2_01_FULL_44_24b]
MNDKKLYVGNLPYSIDKDGLLELFASYGDIVDAVVITDKFTKRSKGFGFVEFAKGEDAQKALALNEKEVDGRKIVVNVARPPKER